MQANPNVAGVLQDFTQNNNAYEDEEEDVEASALEGMLKRVVEKQNEAKSHKQAELISQAGNRIRASADALEATISKDTKDASTMAKQAIGKVEAGLDKITKQIEQCSAQYQADIHALWKAYNEQFDQLATCQQEVKVATDKKRAATKRKLTALNNDSQKLITETDERCTKIRAKGNKMPGLMHLLQGLMDPGA